LTLLGIVISQYFLSSELSEARRFASQDELIESQPGGLTPERLRLVGLQLDLNSATLDDLSRIKGIGPRLAPDVIRLRDKIGKFKSVDELLMVRGMGTKRLESAQKYLSVQPAPPDPRALEGVYSLLGMGPVLLPRSYEPIVPFQLETLQTKPASGVRQSLAILINFSDTSTLTTTTNEYFQDLLFSTGTGTYPYQSLNEFYQVMSEMSFTITGRVAGWFTASGSHDNYSLFGTPCADGPGYGFCGGAVKLVGEAITLAESYGENFSWVRRMRIILHKTSLYLLCTRDSEPNKVLPRPTSGRNRSRCSSQQQAAS
jgi:competence ComEA-like helix-hairpin-helix protein